MLQLIKCLFGMHEKVNSIEYDIRGLYYNVTPIKTYKTCKFCNKVFR